jgi:hypothetical protein
MTTEHHPYNNEASPHTGNLVGNLAPEDEPKRKRGIGKLGKTVAGVAAGATLLGGGFLASRAFSNHDTVAAKQVPSTSAPANPGSTQPKTPETNANNPQGLTVDNLPVSINGTMITGKKDIQHAVEIRVNDHLNPDGTIDVFAVKDAEIAAMNTWQRSVLNDQIVNNYDSYTSTDPITGRPIHGGQAVTYDFVDPIMSEALCTPQDIANPSGMASVMKGKVATGEEFWRETQNAPSHYSLSETSPGDPLSYMTATDPRGYTEIQLDMNIVHTTVTAWMAQVQNGLFSYKSLELTAQWYGK